jgi:hypothetical protein
VILSGGLARYLIPGLGLVDVLSELKVVRHPSGRGTLVTGRGRAWVRRFDNRFLAGLAGGLPQIETDLLRGNDGILRFANLRLTGPAIRIGGSGYRRKDGSFFFEGSGKQGQYGAFAMRLDGRIERPRLAFRLERPNEAMRLANVLLELDPTPQGYAIGQRAARRWALYERGCNPAAAGRPGPDPGGRAERRRGERNRRAAGGYRRLHRASGPCGSGLSGPLLFSPAGAVQRVEAHLLAEDARLSGPVPIAIRRGKLDGVVLLNPGATSIEGTLSVRGLSRGALSIARVDATASLRGGVGQVRTRLAGTSGRSFAFETEAEVAPGRIRLTGGGNVDRRPLRLNGPCPADPRRRRLAAGPRFAQLCRWQRNGERPVRRGTQRIRRRSRGHAADRAGHRLSATGAWRNRIGNAQLSRACRRAADRRRQSAGPGAEPVRPGPLLAAGRYRADRQAGRRQCGRSRRGGERRPDDRARAGAALAHSGRRQPAGAARPCAAVRTIAV